MKNIDFNKGKSNITGLIAVVCIVLTAAAVAAGTLAFKHFSGKYKENQTEKGYSFSSEGFESVSQVKCLNEKFAVFTDSASGKQGLMTLDGKVTEKAEHNSFSVCSDVWRNYRYICESPRSEYLLLVDPGSGTVTSRQYHGLTEPELIPCWSEVGKHLAWTDEKGYAGEVKASELALEPGLYPVATSLTDGAKYGYINQNLQLDIALLYENAMDFSDGIAAVKSGGKWGYINSNGVITVPFELDSCSAADAMGKDCAFSFRNGLAPVCKDGKFGIINEKGESVVDFSFDIILQGNNGVYIASKGGAWGLITVDKQFVAAETTAQTPHAPDYSGTPAIERGVYMVKTSGSVLNLRSAADPNSSVVAKIPNGTELTVSKAVTGWAYVKYNSVSGWVSSDYLVKVTTTQTETSIASITAVSQ